MSLDSSIYFVFLALVTAIYWKLNHRAQNLLLLAASYFFLCLVGLEVFIADGDLYQRGLLDSAPTLRIK